jgi:GTP cyclohydrolase I
VIDQNKVQRAVADLLLALGEDPNKEGIKNTPQRVARMFAELLKGRDQDPLALLKTTFTEDHDEIVMVKDISFTSICEHHLVPFVGKAHIAYIPNENGTITGLSKLVRVVDVFAKRLQVQERMTVQIADTIEKALLPKGVFVVIEAEHLCMSIRGVNKPGTTTVTSAVRGVFREKQSTRSEALTLLNLKREF